MTKNPKRTYNITSLQRGLKLLNLFAKAESGLTATQVAKLSALPTSTVHRRRKSNAGLHAPGGSSRNSCKAGPQARYTKHHQQSSGAAKSPATRATKRLCLGPRGKRSAHSLRGRAHLGSHRRRQCQLEHYRPSGSDADGAAAPTRATRATSRPEDFP